MPHQPEEEGGGGAGRFFFFMRMTELVSLEMEKVGLPDRGEFLPEKEKIFDLK